LASTSALVKTQEVFLPAQRSLCVNTTIEIHWVTICRTATRCTATLGAESFTSDN